MTGEVDSAQVRPCNSEAPSLSLGASHGGWGWEVPEPQHGPGSGSGSSAAEPAWSHCPRSMPLAKGVASVIFTFVCLWADFTPVPEMYESKIMNWGFFFFFFLPLPVKFIFLCSLMRLFHVTLSVSDDVTFTASFLRTILFSIIILPL